MDTAALKDSWALVAKSGDEVPLYFYSHLFLSHPDLRAMFPISMAAQRDKLVDALGRVVSNVDQLDAVTPLIQQLGRDHRRFSVVAEHYSAVGASLLATLKHFLGGAWTDRVAADWAAAYGVIAKVMVEAAESSAESQPAYWEAEVDSVERRTMDVTVLRMRPTQAYDYLPGQSAATFVDSTFPDAHIDASNVPNRDAAEKNCRAAGISDTHLLDNCIVEEGVAIQPVPVR